MHTIPFIDIRGSSPVQIVKDYADKARALIEASRDTFGTLSRVASVVALPLGDKLSKKWLETTANPYREEIDAYAQILGVPGVYALNLCYEWGCTSGAYDKGDHAVLARVLDWAFPLLGTNIVVAHQSGDAGDFYNVTWPGVSGIYGALAPGRFAAALNQAPMRSHNMNYALDWLKNRLDMRQATGLPPAHLLRKVLETAASYEEAKSMLAAEPLALPAIFTLTGTQQGEGCVIERIENEYDMRELFEGRACAANHFTTTMDDTGYTWRARPIDSVGRLRLANNIPLDAVDGEFKWLRIPIANANTRLVMYADAATGHLAVMGMAGYKPVTKVLKIP
jgi:hypothetical protein